MHPTFEAITFHLSRIWDIQIRQPESNLGKLHPPLFFDSDIVPEHGSVYLAAKDNLPSNCYWEATCCFIICGEVPESLYKNSKYGLIIIPSIVPPTVVFNQVQQIYMSYQKWEEALRRIVDENGSLQDLLDVSSIFLGNLLSLADNSYKLLALSGQGKFLHDVESIGRIQYRDVTSEDLAVIQKDIAAHRNLRGAKRIQHPSADYELMVVNIFDGKINVGTLGLHPAERNLYEHDGQLLEVLSSYVQTLMQRPPRVGSESIVSLRNALQLLLADGHIQNEKIAALAEAVGFGPEDIYQCVAIRLPAGVTDEYSAYLRRCLLAGIPAAIAFVHEEYLVALINETNSGSNEKFMQWLASWLNNIGLDAGISDRFNELAGLKAYYREAQAAIAFGGTGAFCIRTFNECWDDYVLTNCTGDLPYYLLFTPGFKRVLIYERDSSVDYVDTLRVWLEEGGNDSRAASRLFICRNTFLYRLDRLKQLLGDDLKDPNMKFRLWLCLRLYEYAEKKQEMK